MITEKVLIKLINSFKLNSFKLNSKIHYRLAKELGNSWEVTKIKNNKETCIEIPVKSSNKKAKELLMKLEK